jgi:hypothetical protein
MRTLDFAVSRFPCFTVFQANVIRHVYSNSLKLHLSNSFSANYNSILFASPPLFFLLMDI